MIIIVFSKVSLILNDPAGTFQGGIVTDVIL